jgi:hypothetical protein
VDPPVSWVLTDINFTRREYEPPALPRDAAEAVHEIVQRGVLSLALAAFVTFYLYKALTRERPPPRPLHQPGWPPRDGTPGGHVGGHADDRYAARQPMQPALPQQQGARGAYAAPPTVDQPPVGYARRAPAARQPPMVTNQWGDTMSDPGYDER